MDHRNCLNRRNRPEIGFGIRKRIELNMIDGYGYPVLTAVKMNRDGQFHWLICEQDFSMIASSFL